MLSLQSLMCILYFKAQLRSQFRLSSFQALVATHDQWLPYRKAQFQTLSSRILKSKFRSIDLSQLEASAEHPSRVAPFPTGGSLQVCVCVCVCVCVTSVSIQAVPLGNWAGPATLADIPDAPGKKRDRFFLFFFLTSVLEYNCFTMVCEFLLYNKVNQLCIYTYIPLSPPSCVSLPPPLPIPPLQVVTKHPADLPVLCGCFPPAIYFTFGSVYMSIPLSHPVRFCRSQLSSQQEPACKLISC